MKLNMGCGYRKRDGYLNIDLFPDCLPDVVCDLESLPWPWNDNSADRVLFNHSLEHLGQDSRTFLGMMKELYRICRDGAEIEINVPHPRHDNFINDPTHVRIITPSLLNMFNRHQCDEWRRTGASNSPLAHYLHVDFALKSVVQILDERFSTQYVNKIISDDDVQTKSRDLNNVFDEIRIVMVAIKSG